MIYDDDYATCKRTYATLRIYPGDSGPEYVTKALGIEPTRIQLAATTSASGKPIRRINAWFLSTKDVLESRDTRRHLDWIASKLSGKENVLVRLKESGVIMDISCFWLSASGHGGPILSPMQMRKLIEMDIEIWWDVYFEESDIESV